MFSVKTTDTQRALFKLNEWEGFWTKETRAKKRVFGMYFIRLLIRHCCQWKEHKYHFWLRIIHQT